MGSTRMLVSDLDGTFIGDEAAMRSLWRDLETAGIFVAFATGRHLESIQDFYASASIDRRADACVTMLGTEIWLHDGERYVAAGRWSPIISEDWDAGRIERIMAAVPEAEKLPLEWQSPFKLSYFLDELSSDALADLESRLDAEGVAAKVVYSADRFLDILPVRAGKGEATSYLAALVGVAPGDVVTAGDTGNDLDMMRPELGFQSIVVGNATRELREHHAPGVYHARAAFAAGIREGLEHFGWLSPPYDAPV